MDHGFITLTLLLLMCIAFLPFPTAVMAEHLIDPDPHERAVAVAFYCGCFTVTAMFYFLMWLARRARPAADRERMYPTMPFVRLLAPTRRGGCCISLATLLAFVHVGAESGDRRRAGSSLHASEGRSPRGGQKLLTSVGRLRLVERVARHVRVPVHKCPVRVVLVRPHVERVEGIETEAIRAFEQMKQLPHELWRSLTGMSLAPRPRRAPDNPRL